MEEQVADHDGRGALSDYEADTAATESGERYSITELSEAFQVTPRAIRFYEAKGLLSPMRKGLSRIYSRRDRVRLSLILRGKRVGFSLAEIKEILDLYDLNDGQEAQLRHAMQKFYERIAVLERQRQDIDDALGELRGAITALETLIEEKKHSPEARDVSVVGFGVSPAAPGE